MYTVILSLHVLGATVWAGGHLVLALTVLPRALRTRDPEMITSFERAYERIGIPALLIQIASGLWLAQRIVPPSAWFTFDTARAAHVSTKFLLLALTLVLAAHARLRIIPRVNAQRLPVLAAHIVAVTVLAVGFVLTGVVLRTGGL